MSKRLVLLFCALFMLAATLPAFAAVQNIKVSGDILARYISRNDFDLRKGNGSSNEDEVEVFNSVVRLRVDADLTDNVQAVIRLINERNWDENNATTSDIDLDLAFVTFKEFLYSPLTLAIGRQELHFGNDMIIGDGIGADPNGNTVNSGGVGGNQFTNITEAPAYSLNNAGAAHLNSDLAYRKAFDAIRATLNYDPLVIDLVYAKIDENVNTGAENNDDVNLYGINAGYKFSDKWNTLAEGYVWGKRVSGPSAGGTTIANGPDNVYVLGGRVSTNPTQKLNLQQEVAWQGGEKIVSGVSRDRNALAAQTLATYVPGWKHNPVFGLIYSYFSGDANVTNADDNKTYHAWDPMFENQTAGRIINAEFPQWNAHNLNLMLKLAPEFLEDVSLRIDWVYQALAKANSAPSATVLTNAMGNSITFTNDKKELGQEIDLTLAYAYTEDVEFALMADWFIPGRALGATNDQKDVASEALVSCKVAF